ncbi:hypothetical protein [Methylosinus sp. PW1]|uniref:hypothetical protein n=1 Tax=Methylosinus sp. PW1 TaxID=107636 RepID=UPI000561C78F|nr:hypothetical protein [Methylosinus sp. PW1]
MSSLQKARNCSEREWLSRMFEEGWLFVRDVASHHELRKALAELRADGREILTYLRDSGRTAILAKRARASGRRA